MMNQSGTGWYKWGFLNQKMGGGGSVESWASPPKPLLCKILSLKNQAKTGNQKGVKNMHKWGWVGSFHCTPLPPHPHKAFLFHRFFPRAHTFLLGFMVLINAWVTGPSHSPEILEFCPAACTHWAGWTRHPLLWPVPFAVWSESVFVCYLRHRAAFVLSAPDKGLQWAERDQQEEWGQLARSTFRVGKSKPPYPQPNFRGPHIIFPMGPCGQQKKV